MENNKKANRNKQEDIALTRALIWFGAAMVLEFLLLLVNKYYINFTADSASIGLALALGTVIKVTTVLGLLGAAVCGFFGWKHAKSNGFLWLVLTTTVLAVGISSGLIVLFYRAAVELLYILVPAMAVLALVYYLYQREFFFSACGTGVGLLGLWLVRKNSGNHDLLVTLYTVVGAVILLAILLLALNLKKNQGNLAIGGKQLSILSKNSNYLPIFLSCAIGLLALTAGLLLGSTAAFYLLFVLLAWLFVLLVYYTVKMM